MLSHSVAVQRSMSHHLCRVQSDLVSLHSVVETLLSTVHEPEKIGDHPDCVTLVRALAVQEQTLLHVVTSQSACNCQPMLRCHVALPLALLLANCAASASELLLDVQRRSFCHYT